MNFVFIQDVGQQQAVQLSEDEQLDADSGDGGDEDIDPTLADEQMDSAVAPISTEPTVLHCETSLQGQWSVNTLRLPTFTISKPTKSPLSSFVPSLPPAPGPAGQQHQGNTDSFTQASTQQVFTPQMQPVKSTDHLAAFAQWLQSGPSSNMHGLRQGPQVQPISQNVAICYITAAEYSALTTVNVQNQPQVGKDASYSCLQSSVLLKVDIAGILLLHYS